MKPCQTYEKRIKRINKRLAETSNIKTVARLTRHIKLLVKLHLWGVL